MCLARGASYKICTTTICKYMVYCTHYISISNLEYICSKES